MSHTLHQANAASTVPIVCLVLDKSYSMNTVKTSAISGTNEFVSSLEPNTMFGIILFDNNVTKLQEIGPVTNYVPLNTDTYMPCGTTALYDAIISAIEHVQSYKDRYCITQPNFNYTYTIVIQTDGQENSSRLITNNDLKQRITTLTSQGWQFIFLGANQDACLSAKSIGISQGSSISYTHSNIHTRRVMGHVANLIARSKTNEQASFTEDERHDSVEL